MQPPVRLKLYGVISLTKRGYLTWCVIGAVGLLVLLIAWYVSLTPETPLEKAGQSPFHPWYLWRQYAPLLIGVGLVLGILEAVIVLRRFGRAEAERQRAPAADTTPKGN
jgi:hypothetical protein